MAHGASLIWLADGPRRRLEPPLPRWKPSKKGGRPTADHRAVFEEILWILRRGARWRDLPEGYGVSPATGRRCLQRWEEDGVWEDVWQEDLGQLDDGNLLGWREGLPRRPVHARPQGVSPSASPVRGKARSPWRWQAARAYPPRFSQRLGALTGRPSRSRRSEAYGYLARDEAVPLESS